MRSLVVLSMLAAGVAHADVRAGSRVRLEVRGESIIGEVYEVSADKLVVVRDGQRVDVSRRSLKELEVRERSRQTERGGFYGFLIGAGAGAILTLSLGRGGDEDDYFLEYTLLPPAVGGLVLGAIVGHFIERDEWVEVDAKTLAVVPRGRDGVALVLQTRF